MRGVWRVLNLGPDIGREVAWQRGIVTAVCAYEIAALWSDLPTITALVHRRPILGSVLVGGLAAHFLPPNLCTHGVDVLPGDA